MKQYFSAFNFYKKIFKLFAGTVAILEQILCYETPNGNSFLLTSSSVFNFNLKLPIKS